MGMQKGEGKRVLLPLTLFHPVVHPVLPGKGLDQVLQSKVAADIVAAPNGALDLGKIAKRSSMSRESGTTMELHFELPLHPLLQLMREAPDPLTMRRHEVKAGLKDSRL